MKNRKADKLLLTKLCYARYTVITKAIKNIVPVHQAAIL
jgi:hypothetical protein